eukprot:812081-Amphidinium_carterae.1
MLRTTWGLQRVCLGVEHNNIAPDRGIRSRMSGERRRWQNGYLSCWQYPNPQNWESIFKSENSKVKERLP